MKNTATNKSPGGRSDTAASNTEKKPNQCHTLSNPITWQISDIPFSQISGRSVPHVAPVSTECTHVLYKAANGDETVYKYVYI